MSRTIRRKNYPKWMISTRTEKYSYALRTYIPLTVLEQLKALAKFHSDATPKYSGGAGPSWFRNMYADRPARRQNAQELRKFMLNPEYEPMCVAKPKLPYWD